MSTLDWKVEDCPRETGDCSATSWASGRTMVVVYTRLDVISRVFWTDNVGNRYTENGGTGGRRESAERMAEAYTGRSASEVAPHAATRAATHLGSFPATPNSVVSCPQSARSDCLSTASIRTYCLPTQSPRNISGLFIDDGNLLIQMCTIGREY